MVDKEIISPKALRKLDAIILHNKDLLKNKELVSNLINEKLIYGLGISLNEVNEEVKVHEDSVVWEIVTRIKP